MHRSARGACLSVAAALLLATASPAHAEDAVAVSTTEDTSFSSTDVYQAQMATSASSQESASAEFTQEAAADGRLVDSSQVKVADIGGGVAAWQVGSKVRSLTKARYTVTDPSTGESGTVEDLSLTGDEELDYSQAPPPPPSGGGMGGAVNLSGGTVYAKVCQTWSYNGNKVTGCYEKIKPTNDGSSTRDYYVYNRWGTATGKVVDWAPDYMTVRFDMRSRPRNGYESRTKGMSAYFPYDSSQLCNEGGSVSLGKGSLSFTMGLSDCSEKWPIPDATSSTMGVIYDTGWYRDSRSKGIEYEQEVWTYQNYAAPSMGFYNYGKFCNTSVSCSATIGKDGW